MEAISHAHLVESTIVNKCNTAEEVQQAFALDLLLTECTLASILKNCQPFSGRNFTLLVKMSTLKIVTKNRKETVRKSEGAMKESGRIYLRVV